jgi:hypothetical protein
VVIIKNILPSWGNEKGKFAADVEPCPGLKGVFYVPGVQDIHMMLFFQLVNFLSKGFNVLIFLFQVGIAVAGTELKLFNFLFQLAYLFFNLLEFLSGLFISHGS